MCYTAMFGNGLNSRWKFLEGVLLLACIYFDERAHDWGRAWARAWARVYK